MIIQTWCTISHTGGWGSFPFPQLGHHTTPPHPHLPHTTTPHTHTHTFTAPTHHLHHTPHTHTLHTLQFSSVQLRTFSSSLHLPGPHTYPAHWYAHTALPAALPHACCLLHCRRALHHCRRAGAARSPVARHATPAARSVARCHSTFPLPPSLPRPHIPAEHYPVRLRPPVVLSFCRYSLRGTHTLRTHTRAHPTHHTTTTTHAHLACAPGACVNVWTVMVRAGGSGDADGISPRCRYECSSPLPTH